MTQLKDAGVELDAQVCPILSDKPIRNHHIRLVVVYREVLTKQQMQEMFTKMK